MALTWGLASGQSQITTGTIQGRVSDASGGVVPGASVLVKNTDTNIERSFVTDDGGRFVVPQLAPGPYTVTVTQPGFATLIQENLDLTVGLTISLDLSLKVSQVEETVVVTDSPTIDLAKTENSSTLNRVTLDKTPVLGRKFEDLLTLTPGVSVVQGPDGDEINFNGQRGIFNNISLDGGDYNNGFFGEQAGGQRAAVEVEFQYLGRTSLARFPPRAVWWDDRRAYRARQDVLFRGPRTDHGQLDARQSERADRDALFGDEPQHR